MASTLPDSTSHNGDQKHLQHLEGIEFGLLDDHSLGATSPTVKMRRDSFGDQPQAFPQSDGGWSGFHFTIENGPSDSASPSQPFFQASQSTAMPIDPQSSTLAQSHWAVNRPSGSCTPTPGFEPMVGYVGNGVQTFGQGSLRSPQQATFDPSMSGAPPTFNASGFPASPSSSRTGWTSASPPEGIERRSHPTANNSTATNLVSSTQVLRRDGIRKKNARFEIPAERNLRTIDQLINQTNDEQEIKELKQQKRLLRNRQAALDSRQRKKQHTERLEEEKKHYTTVISELEEALGEMKLAEAEWAREKENYALSQQQYQHYIESMAMEKEELVRRHTIESGDLRKKNAMLMEQLQRIDSTAMSTAPSSTGFSADFSDFDHIPMNNWDDFSMANDFSIEVEPCADQASSAVAHKKTTNRESSTAIPEDEAAVSSGFLLMLLLCGAWVASRSSPSSNLLPSIPDELRTASASVLDNLYRDSGVHIYERTSPTQPRPSMTVRNEKLDQPKPDFQNYDFSKRTSLKSMHRHLTTPSQQQMRDQDFSLTPSQYNDLSAPSYQAKDSSDRGASRTVGEILSDAKVSGERVADTYTRSLMKDRVSAQVLHDFAQMVTQSNLDMQGRWKAEPVD